MSRRNFANIAAETESILDTGDYVASDGILVLIKPVLNAAVRDTVCVPPNLPLKPLGLRKAHTTVFRVVDANTLVAAKELIDRGTTSSPS
jgi:uncharacterized protein (TIGR02452 family)